MFITYIYAIKFRQSTEFRVYMRYFCCVYSNILFFIFKSPKGLFHCSPLLLIQRTIFLLEKTKLRPPIGAASFTCFLKEPQVVGKYTAESGEWAPKYFSSHSMNTVFGTPTT